MTDARREGLAPDAVVAAALALLDEEGPESFTMRRLAARLHTYPNTIYWHVGNRERLTARVVDRALSEIRVPVGAASWRDMLTVLAHEYRRVVHSHPNIAPLVVSRLLITPPSIGLVELVLGTLSQAGLRTADLARAYNTFVGSLVGWVSLELADTTTGDEVWRAGFAAVLDEIDAQRYPAISANRDTVADRVFALRWTSGRERAMDDSFDFAVQAWLDGIAAAIAGSQKGSDP